MVSSVLRLPLPPSLRTETCQRGRLAPAPLSPHAPKDAPGRPGPRLPRPCLVPSGFPPAGSRVSSARLVGRRSSHLVPIVRLPRSARYPPPAAAPGPGTRPAPRPGPAPPRPLPTPAAPQGPRPAPRAPEPPAPRSRRAATLALVRRCVARFTTAKLPLPMVRSIS